MYAQLCSSMSEYSRRLLSILAQKNPTQKKNKSQLFAQLNCGLRVLEQLIFNIC